MSLRNQKVVIPQFLDVDSVSLANSVQVPDLNQFTLCFEARENSNNSQDWKAFSYCDSSSKELFSFGKTKEGHFIYISDTECFLDNDLGINPDGAFFTETFEELCIVWDSSSGAIGLNFRSTYKTVYCSDTFQKVIAGNGKLVLGSDRKDISSLNGDIYNFRLWNFTMNSQTLSNLSCDVKGTIVDWENDFWNIPTTLLKAENNLTCGEHLLLLLFLPCIVANDLIFPHRNLPVSGHVTSSSKGHILHWGMFSLFVNSEVHFFISRASKYD